MAFICSSTENVKCSFAICIWFGLSLSGCVPQVGVVSTTDWWKQWILQPLFSLDDYGASICMVSLLWAIWKARKAQLFESKEPCPYQTMNMAISFAREFSAVKDIVTTPQGPRPSPHPADWQPPLVHCLKINVDGAWTPDSTFAGAGVIIQNHQGQTIYGYSFPIDTTSARIIEAKAIFFGLTIAESQGRHSFILEGDAAQLMKFLTNESMDTHWDVSTILEDIKILWNRLPRACARAENGEAHNLVKKALSWRQNRTVSPCSQLNDSYPFDPGSGVLPVESGDLSALQDDAVTVIGYPIGGDTISVTSGLEVLSYVHGSTELLGLQIDACYKLGKFWLSNQHQSLCTSFGTMRRMEHKQPTAPESEVLKPSDIILSFDGVEIANDGTEEQIGDAIRLAHITSEAFLFGYDIASEVTHCDYSNLGRATVWCVEEAQGDVVDKAQIKGGHKVNMTGSKIKQCK
ncbi:hypothetical protein HHK36_015165 [Tetracentron sinense]|uniref:RNase H type-1 domain-containing protein n=1 Tax=Tetracentron sinense TaxID=13715 RepID=A0A834Z4L2_TETSI|nr:hypothetical protein HHK36_015165 [Tetracentron sinense]